MVVESLRFLKEWEPASFFFDSEINFFFKELDWNRQSIRVIHKATLSLHCLWASFRPRIPSFGGIHKVKDIFICIFHD